MESDLDLQLVEKNNFNQSSEKYCALSYCWGAQGNQLMTVKENLDQHLQGISFSSLPLVSILAVDTIFTTIY